MGTLRVIGGTARGIRLKPVPGDTTRPITDIVKEALFNILGDEVVDAWVLDLFAGTGAVAIEALSRGAESAFLLDKSAQAVRVIHENLAAARLSERAHVRRGDAFAYLATAPERTYDLVYVAPPQYKEMWQKAMDLLDQQPARLSDAGQVIVQINPLEWVDRNYTNLVEFDRRKYGDTLLIFFEKRQRENDMQS